MPAPVPSLFQSSCPSGRSEAVKKSVPSTARPFTKVEPSRPGRGQVLHQHGAGRGAVALPELGAVVPSLAVKNRVPFTTRERARARAAAPGLMSFTSTVPASVPSLFHSSLPLLPSSAEKNSVPFTFDESVGSRAARAREDVLHQHGAGVGAVALPQLGAARPRCRRRRRAAFLGGRERRLDVGPMPGRMSFTRTVPAAVPSLFQSTSGVVPVVDREEERAVHVRELLGIEESGPGRMSFTNTVPGVGAVGLPQLVAGLEVSRRRRRAAHVGDVSAPR